MADAKSLKIRLNQQQMALVERLLAEGTFGNSIEAVIVNIFRTHAAEMRKAKETE